MLSWKGEFQTGNPDKIINDKGPTEVGQLILSIWVIPDYMGPYCVDLKYIKKKRKTFRKNRNKRLRRKLSDEKTIPLFEWLDKYYKRYEKRGRKRLINSNDRELLIPLYIELRMDVPKTSEEYNIINHTNVSYDTIRNALIEYGIYKDPVVKELLDKMGEGEELIRLNNITGESLFNNDNYKIPPFSDLYDAKKKTFSTTYIEPIMILNFFEQSGLMEKILRNFYPSDDDKNKRRKMLIFFLGMIDNCPSISQIAMLNPKMVSDVLKLDKVPSKSTLWRLLTDAFNNFDLEKARKDVLDFILKYDPESFAILMVDEHKKFYTGKLNSSLLPKKHGPFTHGIYEFITYTPGNDVPLLNLTLDGKKRLEKIGPESISHLENLTGQRPELLIFDRGIKGAETRDILSVRGTSVLCWKGDKRGIPDLTVEDIKDLKSFDVELKELIKNTKEIEENGLNGFTVLKKAILKLLNSDYLEKKLKNYEKMPPDGKYRILGISKSFKSVLGREHEYYGIIKTASGDYMKFLTTAPYGTISPIEALLLLRMRQTIEEYIKQRGSKFFNGIRFQDFYISIHQKTKTGCPLLRPKKSDIPGLRAEIKEKLREQAEVINKITEFEIFNGYLACQPVPKLEKQGPGRKPIDKIQKRENERLITEKNKEIEELQKKLADINTIIAEREIFLEWYETGELNVSEIELKLKYVYISEKEDIWRLMNDILFISYKLVAEKFENLMKKMLKDKSVSLPNHFKNLKKKSVKIVSKALNGLYGVVTRKKETEGMIPEIQHLIIKGRTINYTSET